MVNELCPDDLKTIYPEPTARVIAKARPQVDIHARKFIEMSPFCVLATEASMPRRAAAVPASSMSTDRTGF
jgi:hypothetical protein